MFIIIGVILVLGLIISVYVLRRHSEQVRKDQAIAIADKQKPDKTVTVIGGEANSSEASNTANVDNQSNIDVDLPVTGPEMSIGELTGIWIVPMFVSSYLISRRNRAPSL
jgi:hypothetical protein